MSKEATKIDAGEKSCAKVEPGFFGRIFQKLDRSLKKKAMEKQQRTCCGGNSKGGKCC